MRIPTCFAVAGMAILLSTAALAANEPNVAVFNFEMKSGGAPWAWLEKGLPDLITSDMIRRHFPVIARDEMQVVAQDMRWVPEMINADEQKMKQIKERLKIHSLVTGVYSVAGNTLTITGQIISLDDRSEMFRKEVSGPDSQALELERELSAELVGQLSGASPAQVLKELPPWTQSIPAAKALYEGINLFDQGRYGEAWLSFRQAARQDPTYIDAVYWTARMYYFMNRYEHARRGYEAFVYQDATHPRVGDAIKEYLRTYEKLDAPASTLLDLYDRLGRMYPDADIHNESNFQGTVPNKRWLEMRSAQLLGQLGQHREAVLRAGDTTSGGQYWDYTIATGNAMIHHMLTGEILVPDSLARGYGEKSFLRFQEGQTELTSTASRGISPYIWFLLNAPPGYIFKKLQFFPDAHGDPGSIGMHIHKDDYGDVPVPASSMSLDDARTKGFLFDRLPRCGMFRFHFWLNLRKDSHISIDQFRIVAEFEKLGPHGAIEVTCNTTQEFRVDVDGQVGRLGTGLIGLLPPGEHTLRFYSGRKIVAGKGERKTIFDDWTTKATVQAGHVTPVAGMLPWRADSPWKPWHGVLVGHNYPGYYLNLQFMWSRPNLQMDDQAIRLVWSYMGDLWSSVSTDGDHFSPPAKLGMPISSGWGERVPVCVRERSGRFLLLFFSQRNEGHQQRLYICWSRDFVHWSAPAMVIDRPCFNFDIIEDDQGRLLIAEATEKKLTLLASTDAYHWEELSVIPLPDVARGVKLLQDAHGKYEIASVIRGDRVPLQQHTSPTADYVGLYRSTDAVQWSPRKHLAQLASDQEMSMSMLKPEDRLMLVYFTDANRWEPMQVQAQVEADDSAWPLHDGIGGIAAYDATVAWHSRWGYVMAWATPPGSQFPTPPEGPYVMRGPNLEGLLNQPAPVPATLPK